jgi:hypothetical protein
MADIITNTVDEKTGDDDKCDLLSTIRSRLALAISAYSDSRDDQLDDLRFFAGSPDNNWQWPSDVLSTRNTVQGQSINSRPCLTINKLPQHVRQVTNDQRQNRPAGKVIPADDNADVEIAEILNGIIRHIEYISDADVAYDTACESQVTHGEGFIRILTEYLDENSFDQDIKIARVRNAFSVYLDPMIQDPCGSDAKWCIISENISKDDFERTYPDASPINSLDNLGTGDKLAGQWLDDESVRIVEYFYVDVERKKLNMYSSGQCAFDGEDEDKVLRRAYGKPSKSRMSDKKKIKWVKTNGYEVLEESEWAGKFIPVVRVVGNEFEVEGKMHISGLVRNAKDAQRMYNYWTSQEAEMLALAPKAPFIGYGGQFEGYEQQWKTANTQNWPYLEVNPDVTDGSGAVLPLPQRSQPPQTQSGLIAAKSGAADDIKSTTGQYNASLGQQSNERSGKAINARQSQSDSGTFHYVDNLSRAIRYVTRQLIDLIPKIYDTNRIARIIGEDGKSDMININPEQKQAVQEVKNNVGETIAKIYNPSIGKYDVIVDTGPGYANKRQESLAAMSTLLQGNPQLWAVAGDLFVKAMDWPGAQEVAKRFAKTIDPKIMNDGASPELDGAQKQIDELHGKLENMMHEVNDTRIKHAHEARKLDILEFDARVKAFNAETQRISIAQSQMSPEQIQDIVVGTIHAAQNSGDLSSGVQHSPESMSQDSQVQGNSGQIPGNPAPELPQSGQQADVMQQAQLPVPVAGDAVMPQPAQPAQ